MYEHLKQVDSYPCLLAEAEKQLETLQSGDSTGVPGWMTLDQAIRETESEIEILRQRIRDGIYTALDDALESDRIAWFGGEQ